MAPFVSPSKARLFLQGPDVSAVHELANAVPNWVGLFTAAYQIEGGKILVLALSVDDPQKVKVAKPLQIMEAILFESQAVLLNQIKVWAKQRAEIVAQGSARAHHVLENMLPQGQEFIAQIPDLGDKLALRLKLPRQELNEEFDSLGIIHKAITWL